MVFLSDRVDAGVDITEQDRRRPPSKPSRNRLLSM
jgi:hypothetical protein